MRARLRASENCWLYARFEKDASCRSGDALFTQSGLLNSSRLSDSPLFLPFIPYYIQELGVTDAQQVVLWTGIATSAMSVSFAITAPLWGMLADRHGRKLMVMRATFAGAVLTALMAQVTNVQQLVLLRMLQGALTGTIAAATTLVAGVVPKQYSGAALGSLQTAIAIGGSLGPLLGGIVADSLGYRSSFYITALLLLTSGILVTLLVHEDFHPVEDVTRSKRPDWGLAARFLFASGGALLAVLGARVFLRAGTQILNRYCRFLCNRCFQQRRTSQP